MTSRSSPKKVDLLRSVGCFHGVRACSRVFQAPSYCSPGPPWQWGERCPGWFLERLLSEVFTWQWHLPSWSDAVDGLASPPPPGTSLRCIAAYRGDRAYLWGAIWSCHNDGRWCLSGGKEASRGVVIDWRFCPHWYLSTQYCIVKWVLIRQWLPPTNVMMLFSCVPQA
jgi:hypothetical protein